jgi:hypothetical protein
VTGEIDNITIDAGSGTGVSVLSVAEHVIKVTGSSSSIKFLPMRDGEEPTWIFATGENWGILDQPTWIPATGENWGILDQEEGWRPHLDWTKINDTIEWYRGVA